MHFNIELGTDVAALGVWDAAAGEARRGVAGREECDADVAAAGVFILETGADGSYSSEFYIGEPVPEEKLRRARTVNREYLLRCGSGTLVAGGLEDYRSAKPQITDAGSRMAVPPGAYRLKVHVGESEDQVNEADLVTAVGADDYAYYQKVSGRQSLGCLGVFLAFFPAAALGWKFPSCLVFGLVTGVLGYFVAGFVISLDERYQRILRKVNEYPEKVPALIFELTRIGEEEAEAADLSGGRMRL